MAPDVGADMTNASGSPVKRVLVVGFGMVGIAFVEKLLKMDEDDQYVITIVGDEPHIAYNRVGLTQYFLSRSVEELHINPLDWYTSHKPGKLTYYTGDEVVALETVGHVAHTASGRPLHYDICVLVTGSHGALPPYVSWERAVKTDGVFVYRNIKDLDGMIAYAQSGKVKRAAVVGGGLLGLEAAKALLDLETVPKVTLVERNKWVLSRQLDEAAGNLVLDQVRALGVEVLLQTRIRDLNVSSDVIQAFALESGEDYDVDMIVFAVGIKARDELAERSGLEKDPRGGFKVDDELRTNAPDVYAIGECASWRGNTFGLIAPGVEMADVLAANLTYAPSHKIRKMTYPDLSTKLKLMGVNVASFGDYFADKDPSKALKGCSAKIGPKRVEIGSEIKDSNIPEQPQVQALTYRDPFSNTYKKYLFTADGKYVLGGMMIGDVSDYLKLVGLVKKGRPLEVAPGELIMAAKKEGEEDGDALDDEAQICSCHNVSKGQIDACVKEGAKSLGEIKAKTKCGAGCGGCVPLAMSLFNAAVKRNGGEVSNHLCAHFPYSRQELFNIIKFKKLMNFSMVASAAAKNSNTIGCEVCKPAIASILSSLRNELIIEDEHHQLQDTNDRWMANIQRDGSYSVVPRVPAGEITPAKLRVLGEVAEDYGLYTKITGGQRIDLFGARRQDLPDIWARLLEAGFESGHAYGKSLRTVKSCVGSTWCRYGIGDSVGVAVELEERYKGIRAPHKFKGGVSGCIRECAEAQAKDFGLIATDKGWNLFVGGNGGAKPAHAQLIAKDVPKRQAIRILDRFIIFYIRSADRLQRTARWVESFPGGIDELRKIIINDSLGICADLDREADELVGTFHDEWRSVVEDPSKRAKFMQFANTQEAQPAIEIISERNQKRPADWPKSIEAVKFARTDVDPTAIWDWVKLAKMSDLGSGQGTASCTVKYGDVQLAIFHVPGRGLFASQQMCPHKRTFSLSDGLVGEDAQGREYVACPFHKYSFTLSAKDGGECLNDGEFSIMTFEVKEEGGDIYLRLPPQDALDMVLATSKWMIRKSTEEVQALGGDTEKIHLVAPKEDAGDSACGEGCSGAGRSKLEW